MSTKSYFNLFNGNHDFKIGNGYCKCMCVGVCACVCICVWVYTFMLVGLNFADFNPGQYKIFTYLI